MSLDRRTFLAVAAGVVAGGAHAEAVPPALAAYERGSGGRIGVYAENVVTGAKLGWRAEERFAMCSTFKASLAACILARVDRNEDRLGAMLPFTEADLQPYAPVARQHLSQGAMSIGDMCRAAVEVSDNTCANVLLAHVGGPSALTSFWRKTGDTVSRLDHNEPMLNRMPPGDPRDTTTPSAMAGTLRRILLGNTLAPTSRDQIAAWMVGSTTGADRLRGGLPKAWRIGDKTGNNGKDAFGDIAVAWPKRDTPIVCCVYTQGGRPDASSVTAVFAEIGMMVSQQLA